MKYIVVSCEGARGDVNIPVGFAWGFAFFNSMDFEFSKNSLSPLLLTTYSSLRMTHHHTLDDLDYSSDDTSSSSAPTSHNSHSHIGNCCSHDHSDEKFVYELPVDVKLSACEAFRIEGQSLFKESQWRRAKAKFQKIIVYLDYTFTQTEEQEKKAEKLRRIAMLNSALCALKAGDYRDAVGAALTLVQLAGEENTGDAAKAMFCIGKAKRVLGDFGESREYLLKCLKLVPNNVHVMRELAHLQAEEDMYGSNSAQMARDMFGCCDLNNAL